MAIKGKSKRRAPRSVARGPKPAYTPVKRPIVQRRGFWLTIAVVLGGLAAVGIVYGIVNQRNESRDREQLEATATAARAYSGQLESALRSVGQAVPPSSFQAFGNLAGTLDGLEGGDLTPGNARATVATVSDEARAAAATIQGIDAVSIVRDKGLEQAFIVYVLNSKDQLLSAMRLYEQVAALADLAAGAEEAARGDLIARARGVLRIADEVFGRGYDAYVQAQSLAQTFRPTIPGSGLTGAPGLPPNGSTGATTGSGATASTGSTGASGTTP